MSTVTITQRGTALAMSIAPTQNQNTAPVFEFDCLFTHDLRKKKKTWHDGSLRFHTFNRRIMVYDDSKNFIGDLHYRDTGDLQEGEELRLDKGVLVDVGRRTGQTETDLADVLDKGRHGDEVGQTIQVTPAATHQSVQRGPSLISQGPPKSLAAVLGASQGPVGRARLAIKSPYEQLHVTRREAVLEQPPAKRQRIVTGKDNSPRVSLEVRADQNDRNRPVPPFSPSLPRAPLTERRKVNSSKTVINISSEDEDPVSSLFSSAFGTSRGRQKGTKAMRNPPAKLDLAPKPSKPKQKPLPRLLSVIDPPEISSRAREGQHLAPHPVLTRLPTEHLAKPQAKRKVSEKPVPAKKPTKVLSKASEEQVASSKPTVAAEKALSKKAQGKQKESILPASSARSARYSSGPVTSLRLQSHKSRPKLMYKALLPSLVVASRPGTSRSASPTSAGSEVPVDLISRPRNVTPRGSRPILQPEKDLFHLSDFESISDERQSAPTSGKPPAKPASPSPPRQASSPLFCTQSPPNVAANVMVIEDDSPVPSPIKTPLPTPRSAANRSMGSAISPARPQPAASNAETPPRPKRSSPLRQDSSPLFCMQSLRNASHDSLVIEDDSPVPSPAKTPISNLRNSAEQASDNRLLENSPVQTDVPEPEPIIPPVSRLTLMDQRLMMPPPRIEPPIQQAEKPITPDPRSSPQLQRLATNLPSDIPHPRPFRRVLSESDSPAPVKPTPTASPPKALIPPALPTMQTRNPNPLESRNPFKSPTKLQRAHSDTAAMLQIEMQRPIGRNVNVNVPEVVVDEDVGPWSEREAYLLFHWWPEGRMRPEYGCGVEKEMEKEKQGLRGFMHPREWEGGGAVGVIRDGVDI